MAINGAHNEESALSNVQPNREVLRGSSTSNAPGNGGVKTDRNSMNLASMA